MERIRTALLIAAAAIISVPTLAAAQDNGRQDGRHYEQSRINRGGPPRAINRAPGATPQAQAPRPAPGAQPAPRNFSGNGQPRPDVNRADRTAPRFAPQAGDQRRDLSRRDQRFDNGRARAFAPGTARPDGRPGFNDGRNDRRNWAPPRNGYDRSPGYAQPNRNYGRNDWNRNNWRNDRRYDWRSWRNRNSSLFRAPRYIPPRGYNYGYRLFSPGIRIDPFFYGQGYWIADPWDYRLPPAYGSYRWVRYYNDALLVDIASGIVVDVIQDFFY